MGSVSKADEVIRGLQPYSTCDVSDALLKLKVPFGGFLPGIQLFSPSYLSPTTKIIGPAFTVRFVRKTDTAAPSLKVHYIDDVPKSSIIFISCPPGVYNAVYGGLMTTRAKFSGVVGTVIDGNLRDLPAHQELDFPVFAKGVSTPAFYEVARPSEVDVPVEFTFPADAGEERPAKTTIQSGEWIMGDANGVVRIPTDVLGDVIAMLPKQVEADDRMGEEIAKGMTFDEAKKKFRG